MLSAKRLKKTIVLTLGLCAVFSFSFADIRELAFSQAVAQNNLKIKPAIKPQRPDIKVPKTKPGRFGSGEGSTPVKDITPVETQSKTENKQPVPQNALDAAPLPTPRPVLSFGLPAFVDAPTEERTILVIVSEDADGLGSFIANRYSVDLLDEAQVPLLSARVLRVAVADGVSRDAVVRAMALDPDIIAVQPVYLYTLQEDAGSPAQTQPNELQYSVTKLGLQHAHRISTGKQIPVAIIDTAADFRHSEFGGADTASINVSGFDAVPGSHGTAIAGILAAGATLTGVSPDARIPVHSGIRLRQRRQTLFDKLHDCQGSERGSFRRRTGHQYELCRPA